MTGLLEDIVEIRERSMIEQMQEVKENMPKWRESLDNYNNLIRDLEHSKNISKEERKEIMLIFADTRDYMLNKVITGSSRYAKFYKMMNNGYSQ